MLYLSDHDVAVDQASTGEAASFNVTFTYDPAGNRSVREVDGSLTTYTYDDANRLLAREATEGITTYTLDAAGNPLEKQAPDGTTYYAWDGLNRMVEAEPPTFAGAITFDYNALGQRMTKVLPGGEQKRFIYDFEKLLQESDDTDDPQQTYTATVDEYGDLLSEHDESGGDLYHQYDAQMNTEALLDGDGDVAACYKYSAFGNLAMAGASAAGWSDLTPNEWSGMSIDDWSDLPLAGSQSLTTAGFGGGMFYYRDQETQLFLLGAGNRTGAGGRYYDPELGRFLSDDPLRFNAGDLNLLRYVGNNPVNRSDPSGNEVFVEKGKIYWQATQKEWSWGTYRRVRHGSKMPIGRIDKSGNAILSAVGGKDRIVQYSKLKNANDNNWGIFNQNLAKTFGTAPKGPSNAELTRVFVAAAVDDHLDRREAVGDAIKGVGETVATHIETVGANSGNQYIAAASGFTGELVRTGTTVTGSIADIRGTTTATLDTLEVAGQSVQDFGNDLAARGITHAL